MKRSTDLWFARESPNPRARLRLFCFPYGGAGASVFAGWFRELPSEVEICPVQFPGRETRLSEPSFIRLSSLLVELMEAIDPILDKPFAFFGHSVGALIAFELARSIQKEGRKGLQRLIVSGYRAPHLGRLEAPIFHLSDPQFIAHIKRRYNIDAQLLENADFLKMLVPILKADYELEETYICSPGPSLNCPITAYGGDEDVEAKKPDLEAWKAHTMDRFEIKIFPGDHFFLRSARAELLQNLKHQLQIALSSA